MRVAITGGTGFVGSHVADALMGAGHDVVLMDQFEPRWHPTAMYRRLDIADRESCHRAFQGIQVVFHLAAMSNTQMSVNDPWLCTQLNCVGTVNVLTGARNAGVERVFVAGSTLVSDLQRPAEMPLEGRGWVDESDPIEAIQSSHPYVTSKVFTEMIARDFSAQYGLPTTVFRYGIQYGPRMTPGVVVHSFIERALRGEKLTIHGDGEQWRQYLHVHDVARAHVAAIDHWDESEDRTFNLVGYEKVSINDIAVAIDKVIPVGYENVPARPGDTTMKMCSPKSAEEHLGWKAQIGLQEGIAQTIDWYRKHTASGLRRKK